MVDLFQDEFYIALEGVIDALKHRTMFNLIHPDTGIKVDCWVLKYKEYDELSFSRRRKENIFDQEMYISSPEDVIITKLDWYKRSDVQKHYEDVLGIFQVQQANLDLGYIKNWAKRFSFLDVVEELLKKA